MAAKERALVVYSVGHSTRSAAELVHLLRDAGVELLVDVRRFPVSRRHPQFGREALQMTLAEAGIEYEHEEELGGHRAPAADSPNGGLRSGAFRGYADHMLSATFRRASERLIARAVARRTAMMCAEADPARCHRSILADRLTALGVRVLHLVAPDSAREHALSPAAVVQPDRTLRYPRRDRRQRSLFDQDTSA